MPEVSRDHQKHQKVVVDESRSRSGLRVPGATTKVQVVTSESSMSMSTPETKQHG